MKHKCSMRSRRGFTLVEMLVVIAIIALLLAALLPAFSSVKKSAKVAQTSSYFTALDTGINSYRAEQPLGGSLPPSASDSGAKPFEIAAPGMDNASTTMVVTGAHLLAMALMGADGLGTPGFKDLGDQPGWWDNTHKGEARGLYYIDNSGKERYPRYGSYVDEKMRERAKTLKDLADKGRLLNPTDALHAASERTAISLFLDAWDLPILYYRANPATNRMVSSLGGTPATPGIYRQEDNGLITGSREGQWSWPGLDFGAGAEGAEVDRHLIANAASPDAAVTVNDILQSSQWDNTFARYIIDAKVKARPTPVQKDSYLLISAGPDSLYGTADDITNWTRETN